MEYSFGITHLAIVNYLASYGLSHLPTETTDNSNINDETLVMDVTKRDQTMLNKGTFVALENFEVGKENHNLQVSTFFQYIKYSRILWRAFTSFGNAWVVFHFEKT